MFYKEYIFQLIQNLELLIVTPVKLTSPKYSLNLFSYTYLRGMCGMDEVECCCVVLSAVVVEWSGMEWSGLGWS